MLPKQEKPMFPKMLDDDDDGGDDFYVGAIKERK